jgi:hypothetical protein
VILIHPFVVSTPDGAGAMWCAPRSTGQAAWLR